MDDLNNAIEAKINSFIYSMEADIDGMEPYWKKDMEYLKKGMEGLKEGGTKLLQERPPNGKNVVEETHDENKSNVNHDFIEYNVGLKAQHILKIDMRNFDGKDPITWILQTEKYLIYIMGKTQKSTYCIFIFRTESVCMV